MSMLKRSFVVFFVFLLAFAYGMMTQAWNLFPKKQVEKLYWELYAESEFNKTEENWKSIRTNLYPLEVGRVNLPYNSHTERQYGAIDDLDSGVLIASNLGDFLYLDKAKQLHELPVSIPFSREEFDDVASSQHLSRHWFGVKDILVREQPSSTFQVFASSHHWYAEEQCYTMQFEMAVLERTGTGDFALREDWDTIYETSPCLPLKDRGHTFAGHQAGGRMVDRSDTELLLTIGDHEFDGVNGDKQIITDSTTSYGKIVSVDLRTGESSVVSKGHRNPQGLYIDPEGRIWSTEHGPKGGDELNLIETGKNYGWPHVTYGTDYGAYRWPASDTVGAHPGYKRPVFVWTPSIAISELTGVEASLFSKWKGDLLITSLEAQTLYRTRIYNGRVIYVEPIELGPRLRDIIEMKDGTILIKAATGALLTLRPKGEEPPFRSPR